jgi:alkaline phosphatase
MDAAVRVAMDFARQYPRETLIVVTGDHETGGMSIGFAGTQYDTFFDKVAKQTRSFIGFNEEVLKPYKARTPKERANIYDLFTAINESFGITLESLNDFQKQEIEVAFNRSMGNEMIRPFEADKYVLYGGYEPLTVKLTQMMNQTAGIGWTTYSHTGTPVSVFASGASQELFAGYYDNTEIFHKLVKAMNLRVTP